MARDVLTLGGITFDSWSTPEHMPFGGRQAMAVHKLPGGERVIDALGPDDRDLSWRGRLWGDRAYGQARALDALRRAGREVPLVFAGQAYLVVVAEFLAEIERYPHNINYSITCVISNRLGGGGGGIMGGLSLAAADLAAAALL